MRRSAFTVLLLLLICLPPTLYSQTAFIDSTVTTSFNNAISLYNSVLKDQTNLFNGSEYIEDHPGILGTPFWQYKTLQHGSVLYNDILYQEALLAYDAMADVVVVRNAQQLSIKLSTERIKWFSIGQSYFIHLLKDSLENINIEPGFYNVLINDNVTVLAKRKRISVRVLQPTDHYEYQEDDKFFVAANKPFLPVVNKGDMIQALADKKEDIKKYIRLNKLNFKTNIEDDIIKVAGYYNTLMH